MAISKDLLEILVCPVTKGPLTYDKARQELVSDAARLAYPIRDGIPVMLESEARRLNVQCLVRPHDPVELLEPISRTFDVAETCARLVRSTVH